MWTVNEQPSFLIDSIEYLFIGCIATRPRPRILLVTRRAEPDPGHKTGQ